MALRPIRLRRALSALSTLHRSLSIITPAPISPLVPLQTAHPPSSTSPSFSFLQSRTFVTSRSLLMAAGKREYKLYKEEDEITEDTVLFEGCDFNHWLITMYIPKSSPEEMVAVYEQTCAKGLNISIEEAKKRMYACSTTTYDGFQAVMTEEESKKFSDLPGVVYVLPDSYIDPVNKEYGGDKYENGVITHRRRGGGRNRERNRNYEPRYDRQGGPMQNQQGSPQYGQQGGPQYGQQGGPQYGQQGSPQYGQQGGPQYGQQGGPQYGQQRPTQGGLPGQQQQHGPPEDALEELYRYVDSWWTVRLGTAATVNVCRKLGGETVMEEFNALLKICIVTARISDDWTVALERVSMALEVFISMREQGFPIEEESYRQVLLYLIDKGMVESFHLFTKAIRYGGTSRLARLGYYESLMYIRLNDEEKYKEFINQEFINRILTSDGDGTISLRRDVVPRAVVDGGDC